VVLSLSVIVVERSRERTLRAPRGRRCCNNQRHFVSHAISLTTHRLCMQWHAAWLDGAQQVTEGAYIGCSIAVNGVCLTVTTFDDKSFEVNAAPETLRITNLSTLLPGAQTSQVALSTCVHSKSSLIFVAELFEPSPSSPSSTQRSDWWLSLAVVLTLPTRLTYAVSTPLTTHPKYTHTHTHTHSLTHSLTHTRRTLHCNVCCGCVC
jgi:hypothetical protein